MSTEQNGGEVRPRRAARRRRANVEGGRTQPIWVGLSAQEKLALKLRADALGWSVQRLLVESALADHGETATQRQETLAALMRALQFLGAVSNNVNQIARATNATGEVLEELAATLAATRRAVERVRAVALELGAER